MYKKILSLGVIVTFFLTTLGPYPQAHADTVLGLPQPGTMVNLSPAYIPALIKGLTVHKDNPFLFDFIVDTGHSGLAGDALKKEGDRLVKYFFACLTIPEKDLWVNLSPYEKDRMLPNALGQTALGRDLLAQDYILKQLTASLIYPEKNLGREFWDRVYSKARQIYGTTQIPVNTFNKVWIVADKASVYEHGQTVFVVSGHMKVMLEEDYLSLQKHGVTMSYDTHSIGSNIVRQIVLPEIEKEVNTGRNFSTLRQIFNSLVLASWYKKNLKEALLNQVYADKSTVKGVNLSDPSIKEKIYRQYLKAYKKGVFNYIKEDTDPDGQTIPRKYFSGGFLASELNIGPASPAEASRGTAPVGQVNRFTVLDNVVLAMTAKEAVGRVLQRLTELGGLGSGYYQDKIRRARNYGSLLAGISALSSSFSEGKQRASLEVLYRKVQVWGIEAGALKRPGGNKIPGSPNVGHVAIVRSEIEALHSLQSEDPAQQEEAFRVLRDRNVYSNAPKFVTQALNLGASLKDILYAQILMQGAEDHLTRRFAALPPIRQFSRLEPPLVLGGLDWSVGQATEATFHPMQAAAGYTQLGHVGAAGILISALHRGLRAGGYPITKQLDLYNLVVVAQVAENFLVQNPHLAQGFRDLVPELIMMSRIEGEPYNRQDRDYTAQIRSSAANILAQIGDPRAVGPLLSAADNEIDPRVRPRVILAAKVLVRAINQRLNSVASMEALDVRQGVQVLRDEIQRVRAQQFSGGASMSLRFKNPVLQDQIMQGIVDSPSVQREMKEFSVIYDPRLRRLRSLSEETYLIPSNLVHVSNVIVNALNEELNLLESRQASASLAMRSFKAFGPTVFVMAALLFQGVSSAAEQPRTFGTQFVYQKPGGALYQFDSTNGVWMVYEKKIGAFGLFAVEQLAFKRKEWVPLRKGQMPDREAVAVRILKNVPPGAKDEEDPRSKFMDQVALAPTNNATMKLLGLMPELGQSRPAFVQAVIDENGATDDFGYKALETVMWLEAQGIFKGYPGYVAAALRRAAVLSLTRGQHPNLTGAKYTTHKLFLGHAAFAIGLRLLEAAASRGEIKGPDAVSEGHFPASFNDVVKNIRDALESGKTPAQVFDGYNKPGLFQKSSKPTQKKSMGPSYRTAEYHQVIKQVANNLYGGIDLNTANMGMTVTRDAHGGVKINIDPDLIQRIEQQGGVQSAVPIIINVSLMNPAEVSPLLGFHSN